jgi:hypothetical protein
LAEKQGYAGFCFSGVVSTERPAGYEVNRPLEWRLCVFREWQLLAGSTRSPTSPESRR